MVESTTPQTCGRSIQCPSTPSSQSATPSDNKADPCLALGSTEAEARLFRELLGLDRDIAQPPSLRLRGGAYLNEGDGGDGDDGGGDDGGGDDGGGDDGGGDDGGGDDGDDDEYDEDAGDGGDGSAGSEDDEDGMAEPQIQVSREDEHPTLWNICLWT
ncbi:hypothetical protein FRC12_020168 [Ceratobasidium sp. 428]|nr:hypothetical protein FRC12_020168 [Ceratobasidium sp. 428]